ncbi:hypothetical protein QYE76_061647 [Lolium multiflorum]|uniref:Retrotransposon Copia-like N-terminal domain-containing protein n=1 Tax=Lolium multiflorum TaxID=4521 RepID=A0AAD8S492_LOLMU|nr:hypothetical protein QYE76_061647 [Lolium multiflorum]
MGSSGAAMQLSFIGPVVSPPVLTAAPTVPTVGIRLDRNNFALWRALTLTNLSGASLHGYLDGTVAAPAKTTTEGTGDAARQVDNPAYATWWTQDQKVLGVLLSSMTEEIASQLLGCKTAAAAWTAIHAMFSAQSRAGALADAMATAGSPLRDDEIIDYMLTGLGSAFNPIVASLNMITRAVTAAEFYSMVLNYEGLQMSQLAGNEEWTSSANAAARGGAPWQPRAPSPAFSGGGSQPGYGGGNNGHQNYGGNSGGGGYGSPTVGHVQPYGPPAGGNGNGRQNGGNYGECRRDRRPSNVAGRGCACAFPGNSVPPGCCHIASGFHRRGCCRVASGFNRRGCCHVFGIPGASMRSLVACVASWIAYVWCTHATASSSLAWRAVRWAACSGFIAAWPWYGHTPA